jgi:hypothetical protein
MYKIQLENTCIKYKTIIFCEHEVFGAIAEYPSTFKDPLEIAVATQWVFKRTRHWYNDVIVRKVYFLVATSLLSGIIWCKITKREVFPLYFLDNKQI